MQAIVNTAQRLQQYLAVLKTEKPNFLNENRGQPFWHIIYDKSSNLGWLGTARLLKRPEIAFFLVSAI